MPLRPDMEPKEFLEVFLRRKWLVLFSIVLVMLGAAVYCVAIPDQFQSTATILVLTPLVSENYVRPLSDYRIQDRIPAIQQQVFSRTRLLAVMDELGLYREKRGKGSPEALVKRMQGQIEIKIIKGKDAFTLSFNHESPKMAMLTAAKLASFFIEENIRTREQQAITTSEFLESQLKETKARLEAQEEKVKRYKLLYMGELPQEMETNLNRMTRMQDQLRTNADAVSRLEDRKVFLESKISDLQKEIGTIEGQMVDPEDPTRNLLAEISARRKRIRELTLKYTSKYPTVLQLQREVEELKKKVESLRKSGPLQKDGLDEDPYLWEPETRKAVHERQEMGRLREQVASLKLEISSLKKEREETRKSIDSIQDKVSRLPQREQEMISLTRDYDNLKKAYDELLTKKLGARVSQKLEEGQKGETFQVIDPPDLPSIPSYPDRLKILGISILAAIAVGFGGAIGREMLDPTLKSPKEFKHYFELPILASLPVIQSGGGDRMKMNLRMALLVGSCSLLSAIVVFLFVYRENIQAALQITGGTG
jgi:polysaccharide chain length determinant protein (PEP-CTERM system associated)